MVRSACTECGSSKTRDIFKFSILFSESKTSLSLKSDLDLAVMQHWCFIFNIKKKYGSSLSHVESSGIFNLACQFKML